MAFRAGSDGQGATRRLLVWFVATALLPAVALAWLGLVLIEQDGKLDEERQRVAREQFAELAATALQRTLAQLEAQIASIASGQSATPPVDRYAAAAVLTRRALVSRYGVTLPYYPAAQAATALTNDVLSRADVLEFARGDIAGALRLLAPLTSGVDPALRAEALLREGRLRRKAGDTNGARAAFARLEALDAVPAGGTPAGLAGAQAAALLLETPGDALRQLAERIRSGVLAGRWPLTREQHDLALAQTREWLGDEAAAPDPDRLALASAIDTVWIEWRRADFPGGLERARRTRSGDRATLVLLRASSERMVAMAIGASFLDRRWRETVIATGGVGNLDLALTDADGLPVLGSAQSPMTQQSVRTASMTNLPWTVHAIDSTTSTGRFPRSRSAAIMLGGIGLMMLVVVTGGYFITRAMARELRVARLQSDFVAAVSHEFRTPLTAVRQLSEMLVGGRVSDDKRTTFYATLLRESDRLQRLVESLLDFARLEAGQLECRLEAVAPASFVRELVRDFVDGAGGRQVTVDCSVSDAVSMKADPMLLGRALWNLLDNAVKYSEGGTEIAVSLEASPDRLFVRVRDRGIGIPAEERQEIFRKFARGAASKQASIRGTGIGLAMAREIVRAHGGDITVASQVSHGSTFSVELPLGRQAAGAVEGEPIARGSLQ